MPPETTIGARIRGRLPVEVSANMTDAQIQLAKRVIEGLRRTDTKGRGAKGQVRIAGRGRVGLKIESGRLWQSDTKGMARYAEASASVSMTVCKAVLAGAFSPEYRQEDHDHRGNKSETESFSDSEGGIPEGGSGDGDQGEDGQGDDDAEGQGDGQGEGEAEGDGEGEGDGPPPPPPPDPDYDPDNLKARLDAIADWLNSSDAETPDGKAPDQVSNRAYIDGAKMLAAGIPVRGILHAYALNWTESSRAANGIETWDPAEFGLVAGKHRLYAYVRALVEADVPVFLVGPTQAGKSFVYRQVITDLGLSYAEGPLTQGASTSWLLGTHTAAGWVEAPFPRQYGEGGGYCFEEGDAAGPDLVVVLNNALTNGSLHNPRNGVTVVRHRDFRAGMTGNTFGTGAADGYRGRSAQDKAVLERFRMGRLLVGYDRELQHQLFDAALADAARESFEGSYR